MEPAETGTSRATVRQRHRARVLALQTLYEADLTGHRPAEVLRRLSGQLHSNPEALAYARELIAGVIRHLSDIDVRVSGAATAWPLDQMSAVDRNVLRLGIFEALYNSSTIPVAVAVNEAIELAKLYGSESSSKLIHGVLGNVVAQQAENAEDATRSGNE